MPGAFPILERSILKAKGISDAQIAALESAGIGGKADFATVGDAATLAEIVPELTPEVAAKVMAWAVGAPAAPAAAAAGTPAKPILIDSPDLVYCVHCGAKQPKDYSSGDLCSACGKQAEAILSCFWCSSSGPGKFCRQCGAQFVPTGDFDLAVHLKREGLPKDEVPKRLAAMSPADRDVLWGRVRKLRG
ncbi:MAG: hypothetical protein J0M02_16750 [Planctomycetes bacterium]|nr:hypothetical protein [Planctomycetota bacterium]